MITKYFSEENLWKAKVYRFVQICKEQGFPIEEEAIYALRIPAWNITMVLKLAGYAYHVAYPDEEGVEISFLDEA